MSAAGIEPFDPWITARELVFAHGSKAALVARTIAEDRRRLGDATGQRAWRRVLAVLRILSSSF